MDKNELANEVAQRSTFAIISHHDAGKTTITEQLLLFGGVIREAGTVKGKKSVQEGAVQLYRTYTTNEYILGAVGQL